MGKRSAERSAACATCGKTFARSDTLLRHEKSHHATEDRGPVHRVTNGTFRACSSCAQARSRCSGGLPCGRCKTRNLECTYPNKRRKGNGYEQDFESTFQLMEQPQGTQLDVESGQQQFPVQFQQFIFSPDSGSSHTNSGQVELSRVNSAQQAPQAERTELHTQRASQGHPESAVGLPLNSPTVSHMTSMEASLHSMTSAPRQMDALEHYNPSSAQDNFHNPFDEQQVPYNDNSLYDESLNLNWLPLSIYPSPYGDMEQDFSFLLPNVSDTTSMNTGMGSLSIDRAPDASSMVLNSRALRPSPSYQLPASMSSLMQSPASTVSDNIAPVGFSFDNIEIPDSKKKRRKHTHIPTGFSKSQEQRTDFEFPDMSSLSLTTRRMWCSEDKYTSVAATFQRLCVDSSRWTPFSTSQFPAFTAFNTCIELYFDHLHSTFPLIHAPTFEHNADWLICLATAAIGSTFASVEKCADAREAFQEFLRRAVLATTDRQDGDFRNVHLAQARILALVGLAQSDREQLRSRAPRSHADIARWCLESSILQLTAPDEEVRSDEDIDAAWHRWVQRESLRRVGYFIWYLDCALGYIGNARPLCNMDDARAPLPCAEVLWDAPSAGEWLKQRNNTPQTQSLCAALEMMYTNKRIDPGLSEISQVLLIHALYSRTWEVGTHIKQPLSEWKATGTAKGFLRTPSKDDFWLPLYPLYANWRNSACDCLDVLHWQANAVTARNAGAEHHGVLHLHLARIILLTPFQEIQDLLFFLINHRVSDLSKASFYVHDGSYQPRNPAKLPLIRKITWRWLREDQHKARLAMIHAGSVFWHVRRYSQCSFFEPLAIYLASIVLWTYGSYKSAALERDAASAQHDHNNTSDSTKSRHPHEQTRPELGNHYNIQPTRVERAAQYYAESRVHSSRSRSVHNGSSTAGTNANSPAQLRSRFGPDLDSPSTSSMSPGALPTTTDNDHTSPASCSSDSDSDSTSDQPTFIHLDRPCDDEIVQHFVRNGHNMSGYMSNVGDICQTPQKVLLEGAKVLRTKLACWGVSREYHDILVQLADMRKDKVADSKRMDGARSVKGGRKGDASGAGFHGEDVRVNQ